MCSTVNTRTISTFDCIPFPLRRRRTPSAFCCAGSSNTGSVADALVPSALCVPPVQADTGFVGKGPACPRTSVSREFARHAMAHPPQGGEAKSPGPSEATTPLEKDLSTHAPSAPARAPRDDAGGSRAAARARSAGCQSGSGRSRGSCTVRSPRRYGRRQHRCQRGQRRHRVHARGVDHGLPTGHAHRDDLPRWCCGRAGAERADCRVRRRSRSNGRSDSHRRPRRENPHAGCLPVPRHRPAHRHGDPRRAGRSRCGLHLPDRDHARQRSREHREFDQRRPGMSHVLADRHFVDPGREHRLQREHAGV